MGKYNLGKRTLDGTGISLEDLEERIPLDAMPAAPNGYVLMGKGTDQSPAFESAPGGGDMMKSVYDPDLDGKIAAAQLTGVPTLPLAQSDVTNLVADLSNKTTLVDVKADTDIASAINLKHNNNLDHSNSLDHTQGTDQGLDVGGTNAVTALEAKIAYGHSQASHAPTNAQKNSDILKSEIEGVLTGEISSHNHAGSGGQAFPIGSVFLSVVNTNPATLLGYGAWSQIAQGQFLVGQKATDSDFDIVEETGGAKTHTHTDHPALTHTGGAVGTIAQTATAGIKIGTAGITGAALTHIHPAPSFTQPSQHNTQGHDSPSHLPPYFVVYIWRRDS